MSFQQNGFQKNAVQIGFFAGVFKAFWARLSNVIIKSDKGQL
jgi:hypothetical protein